MAETIQIYIVDDHAILREGLKALIATEPGMKVVGEAADGEEAGSQIKELKPDVILLDLKLPNKDGLEVINETIRDNPQARILVLTNFADDDKVLATIQAGALGYLLKDTLPDELLKAIRDVYRGESHLHPVIARKVIRQISKQEAVNQKLPTTLLTARELEVLTLVSQGLSNQEIADRLLISERTVRTHVSNILEKLHLASRTQAILYALREGFVKLEPS
jgi:NarL family two-component system response regulator LiaR